MIIYGTRPVAEALRGRRRVLQVWATERAAAGLQAVDTRTASPEQIEELCGSAEHQGVCAETDPYPYVDAEELLQPDDAIVVCLDEVQDPHNLGAVCRVAESAGVAGVVLPERRSAAITPAACRASAGAVEHLRVARVRNLADWLGHAKADGAWIYGAAAEDATPWDSPDYGGKVVLVLGSEGRGLRPRVAASCDALVGLPMLGHVGSLNVSTAAAALLYGILHLRGGVDRRP